MVQEEDGSLKFNWANPDDPYFTGVIVVAATGGAPAFIPADGLSYTVGQSDVIAAGLIDTFVDAPLENGLHRYYKIFAYDSMHRYSPPYSLDAISADTAAPSTPMAIQAIAGEGEVTLSWTNPADSDFGGVLVFVRQGAAPTGKPVAGASYNVNDIVGDAKVVFKGSGSTALVQGLTAGQRYYFSLYAFDESPNYSSAASADSIPVSISIVGQLVNAEGLASISGATVTITKGTDVLTTTTQADGKFSFINVPPGVYDIGFSSPDYWSPTGSVTVQEGISARWDIVAIPNDMISRIRSGYVTQEALDQAIASMFTKEQLDKAVAEERTKWDIGGDGKLGMAEVIYILQSITNSR
jgi:hypothetical protein